ncbi:mechanosensitive ion channel family protein [Novosphingobium decolorationis]|uniref:Small-conductance mechanosensitive channel n=1 Tax=Novosphingobium decolorationis TaxID=2698673 RepID=A0ABX8E3J1_9SPHN|nr:mechanosensitive ion channel family protein [Novosphingobium decolorationis]QVM82820.1 mechanosensitive ion channel family protein [Novosphingobium decolorationis]
MNYIETLTKELEGMAMGFFQLLPSFAIALGIVILTRIMVGIFVRIVSRVTQRANLRTDLQQLFETLTKLAVWILGILIALTVAIPSFTPAGAVAGLGVGALAIGFAFQDIFENFLAGVLIMLREKMNIGDSIACNGIMGSVERITLRETYVRQFSGELTVVPNSMLFKNPVDIFNDQAVRREQVVVGVSYDTDLETAEATIRKAVESIAEVDKNKGVLVFAQEFGASSVDFLVLWWSNTGEQDKRLTKSHVIMAIKKALDDAEIEIPFPYVTHTFKEALPVEKAPLAANES